LADGFHDVVIGPLHIRCSGAAAGVYDEHLLRAAAR
jgi:hypothetical protein